MLSANNQIGQAIGPGPAGAGNVISGNAGNGVHILGPAARGNVVANNEIGTQIGLARGQPDSRSAGRSLVPTAATAC